MGNCFPKSPTAGLDDKGKQNSKLLHVTLSTGMQVPVWVLPTDTMRTIDRKVSFVHGKQPKVLRQGEYVEPMLNANFGDHWERVRWDVLVTHVNQDGLMYDNVSDLVSVATVMTHQYGG